MKLIFAIVQDEDADNLTDALVSEGFRITRIGSTGSFLRMGNSSIMVGVEAEQLNGLGHRIVNLLPDAHALAEAADGFRDLPLDEELSHLIVHVFRGVQRR